MVSAMGSLESKLERLAPEQRKEVEDFVDFLIFRSGEPPAAPRMITQAPPVLSRVPPPMETVPLPPAPAPASYLEPVPPPPSGQVPAPVQESLPVEEDWITRDYIDYGQFEQTPSPATEAVKKVKQKINQREEQEKSHQLLDWID
jgi:hypothetical protein